MEMSMSELLSFATFFIFCSEEAFPNHNHLFITPCMCIMVLTFPIYCVPLQFDQIGIIHDLMRFLP